MTRRILARCLVCAVMAFAVLPAHASRDAVQFASDINVPQGSSVHDAVCFFCSVNAQGAIDHDVVVFFGNVRIASRADHDVVNFFGQVVADDNAAIGHDLVSFFGVIQLGQNVVVDHDLVVMLGSLRAANSVSIGKDRVIEPAWLLCIPFLILGLIIFLVVHAIRSYRERRLFNAYQFPPRQ